MSKTNVGISDIELYIPPGRITLEKLISYRSAQVPEIESRLQRSLKVTGQLAIRFPHAYQDNATLAATSAYNLFARRRDLDPENLRYIAVGTETTVDHSKPVAAYMQGMLQESGFEIPCTLSTFQVQHACAGGTLAVLSISALLQTAARNQESGLVVCSDIARYEPQTTAELTQGAGAAALYIERDPQLLNFDLSSVGYCSSDVDDFFRPLGSITAKVQGKYSVECYHEAFDKALVNHASRCGWSAAEVLKQTDIFALHVPFRNMALTALKRAVETYLGLDPQTAEEFLEERGFQHSLEAPAQVGNIYTGSVYLALASALQERYEILGDDIVGKNVLIISYGSGNTMSVMRASVAEAAPSVIAGWDLDSKLYVDRDDDLGAYLQWAAAPQDRSDCNRQLWNTDIPEGSFALKNIRDDGYREYGFMQTDVRDMERHA